MPKLTYVVGGETRSVDVGDSCSIGSLPGGTVVLDASLGVSRRHCQILKIQNGYEIADLGSTNGTKVNGDTVKKRRLASGDRIEAGRAVLTFEDGPAAGGDEVSLEEPAGASAPAAAPRSGGGASDQCMLVFAGGDKDGQKIALDKPRITFGRNAKNSVQLADTGASGFHAEIAREGGAYVLRDLGSTNGTLVDGEPVSETALQHGARIRMGATRFVFVDPTVSDFEKAMAAVDDLGSEWGLLRAEMDMTRVQEARRSQAILIGLTLVVVLGGGAYVVTHPEAFSAQRQQVAAIDGNKIPDFSFEDRQGADWTARGGTPTKARAADPKSDGAARTGSGSSFYAVTRDGAGGTCAAAQSSLASVVTVSPGKTVDFGAQVRASGGAMGGVRIVWLDKPDAGGREIARNASSLTSASDWQAVKGTAMPPEGARAARLELLNAAAGTAYFDDVYVVVGGGGAGGGQTTDGAVRLSASADGQATVSRADVKLLVDGAVVGGALRGGAISDPSSRGDRTGSQSLDRGGLAVEGRLVDPTTAEAASFTLTIASSGGRFVDVKGKLPGGEAAWVATLPEEFVAAGIAVRTESDYRRASEPYLFDKVLDAGFGGPHRFKVTKGEGCGPLRMALYKVGAAWEVGFGAADGNLSLRIDTDSAALIADIEKLKTDAASAKQQKKYGTAIAKFKQLSGFYPAGSADFVNAEQEWKSLEEQGLVQADALEKRVAGSVQFKDTSELTGALADAERLSADYADTDIGRKAAAQKGVIENALAGLRAAAAERLAAPLLRKADDFFRHRPQMTALAKAFYGEIVHRFPGTQAEKKAREQLAKL